MKILIFYIFCILNLNLYSQKLLIKTDTSNYIYDLTTKTISKNGNNIDTNNYINLIKDFKNNEVVKVYKVDSGKTIGGINDTIKIKYFIKCYDTLDFKKNTIYYNISNDSANFSYIAINKDLKKKLIISSNDGTIESFNNNNFLEWRNNGYYGDCMINRNIIYYQFDCRYEHIFLVKNRYIIAKKYYSNLWTLFRLKQKYEKIDWGNGEKLRLCKDCKIVLLSKNEEYLVFETNKTKNNNKHFIIIEVETNKIIKEFYAKEIHWIKS